MPESSGFSGFYLTWSVTSFSYCACFPQNSVLYFVVLVASLIIGAEPAVLLFSNVVFILPEIKLKQPDFIILCTTGF